jgi:hypothetical protein
VHPMMMMMMMMIIIIIISMTGSFGKIYHKARCRSYCCNVRAINISCSEYIFVAFTYPARKAQALYYIACGLYGSTKCFHIISYTAQFFKNILNIKCVLQFSLQRFV